MKILGIETSCDETAAAVVEDGRLLLSNVVSSSIDLHRAYGGVVPEIAARSHIEVILPVIHQALDDAGCRREDIDGIAVTCGAGLGGSLLIGVMTARTLAIAHNKPLYAVNHVEAHVYANFLTKAKSGTLPEAGRLSGNRLVSTDNLPAVPLRNRAPAFPMLALIVSGGHTQLALFQDHSDYRLLGQTADDAIGEAFDKVAKMLGLPYPGGPSIAEAAKKGDPEAFKIPKAQVDRYGFSFSGPKTAVLRLAQAEIGASYDFPSIRLPERLSDTQKADIAASFQRAAIETVVDKTKQAFDEFAPASVVIAGGVAASQELRRQLAKAIPIEIEYPHPLLCTDNGAMVATLGCFNALREQKPADPFVLAIEPNLSM